ncbi:TRAP transporter TatT component family protein [Nitrosomonas marina]|nr:TRAP transporter TatT component family protein [Nitrosomonas marina]
MCRWQTLFLNYSLLLVMGGITHAGFARAASEYLPDTYQQKIDRAVQRNAIDRSALLATIAWIKQLAQTTQAPEVIAELARLQCANAEVENERNKRIELYKSCMDIADRALAIHSNAVVALYWKAVAMGKLSEESGILNALRFMRPMEKLFLRVIELDEQYDQAGAHKALGRMYHKLPRFPISIGNKEKSLFHLKRALRLFPNDIIARAFYAELLFELGNKQEAYRHARYILDFPVETENSFRYRRFIDIARHLSEKAGA